MNDRELLRYVAAILAAGQDIRRQIVPALVNYRTNGPDGFVPRSDSDRVSGGAGHSDPVVRLALGVPDPLSHARIELERTLIEAGKALRKAQKATEYASQIVTRMQPPPEPDHEAASDAADEEAGRRITQCLNPNCGRDIMNTPVDRPRAGLCHSCYTWRVRHKNQNRPKVVTT